MRILIIHAKSFWWKVRQPARISLRDEVTEENAEFKIENALIAFTAVEKSDEQNLEKSCERAVEAIKEVAGRVKVKQIILYPYAHLSTNLSKPSTAIKALKTIHEKLVRQGFSVYRSPFGYYKEFILHCSGHPLAESLRVV
ncbi:MAG: threonyl-tRNA synthetase editing domain-containing protein [archaeon GB-1867-005]|nr:threonyl-tRNA synthetase editing domain-containing protein [Candidatus Culexmicrobium cathedralense]